MADCTQGIENRERILALEKRIDKLEVWLSDMAKDIKQIRAVLLGRPSWFVCTVFALLTGTCAALASWAITVLLLVIKVG